MRRRPPIGTVWRIKAGGLQRGKTVEPRVEIYSRDYPDPATIEGFPLSKIEPKLRQEKRTTFDELVIVGVLHVEAMGGDTYFLSVGDDKLMIRATKDGPKKGEWYR